MTKEATGASLYEFAEKGTAIYRSCLMLVLQDFSIA